MVRFVGPLCIALTLAACGGRESPKPPTSLKPPAVPTSASAPAFASGPIGTACLNHRRTGATPARCSCVQAAANQTLSQAQQKRSVLFFSEPGKLQDIRQSSAPANARLWDAWQRFADTAQTLCTDV